ncbi:MAG: hypothetical protein HC812_10925 [Leptolyngbya sp. RL_3_1]|nr:hypothetical protein [Leptolyngbya sp. RL_3_1]
MDYSKWSAALLTIVLSLLLSLARPALAAPLSIGQVRQMPNAMEVTVTGRITVTSGQFESASFDKGFALQDPEGGIYVSTTKPLTSRWVKP